MQVVLRPRRDGDAPPENLITEAEIHFDPGGPLEGLRLVGFSIWRGRNGKAFVTLPAKRSHGGAQFFEFLRAVAPGDEGRMALTRVKQWIIEHVQKEEVPQ